MKNDISEEGKNIKRQVKQTQKKVEDELQSPKKDGTRIKIVSLSTTVCLLSAANALKQVENKADKAVKQGTVAVTISGNWDSVDNDRCERNQSSGKGRRARDEQSRCERYVHVRVTLFSPGSKLFDFSR